MPGMDEKERMDWAVDLEDIGLGDIMAALLSIDAKLEALLEAMPVDPDVARIRSDIAWTLGVACPVHGHHPHEGECICDE